MSYRNLYVITTGAGEHWLAGAATVLGGLFDHPDYQHHPVETGTFFEVYPGASRSPRPDSCNYIPLERGQELIRRQDYKDRQRAEP